MSNLIEEAEKHLSAAATDRKGNLWYQSDTHIQNLLTHIKQQDERLAKAEKVIGLTRMEIFGRKPRGITICCSFHAATAIERGESVCVDISKELKEYEASK